jgi:hypothetical protein
VSVTVKRIRLSVSAEDIAEGKPGTGTQCPVARALGRRGYPLSTDTGVYVFDYGITLYENGYAMGEGRTNDRMKRFINAFDGGEPVAPTTFLVEVPQA